MKYLIDTNIVYTKWKAPKIKRADLYVLDDVLDESAPNPDREVMLKEYGVQIIIPTKKHFEKLKDVLKDNGSNFKLIRLYSCEGNADVIMIAYILAEHEFPNSLFSEEFSIITRDNELIKVAKSYGIECLPHIPDYENL